MIWHISNQDFIASNEENTGSPLSRLLARCQNNLFDIAVLFHDVDLAIMRVVQLDRELYEGLNAIKGGSRRTRTVFNEVVPEIQNFESHFRAVKGNSVHDLDLTSLIDTRFNNIRSLAAIVFVEFQGEFHSSTYTDENISYIVARERARVILDLRSNILDLFEGIEDELLQQKLRYLF